MKITNEEIRTIATENRYEYAALKAVIMVEGSGKGYDPTTGKILIQFEPHWFKKLSASAPQGLWTENKVGVQSVEWQAFDDAFSRDSSAAMQSTSWGMMQVMGFHYKVLGFNSVGEMVDFAKASEANQVILGVRFINSNKKLKVALIDKDWAAFAYSYNGSGYKVNKYDTKLAEAYSNALSEGE